MPALTLANLALYAAQAALLIGALALTLAALRPAPAFRLAACRALLVVLLLLPFQALLLEAPRGVGLMPAPTAGAAFAVDAIDAHAGRRLPWGAIVGGLVGLGIALRSAWLALGLWRLRRLARGLPDAAQGGVLQAEIDALQAELETRARVVFVDRVAQPVTFGIAPAIVLLPASLLAATTDRRRAVLCHELLHVRRRDWLWVLGEEVALTLLWFHPAAWWLIGELQLAREQVVDRLTVAATGARRDYMDALLSAADLPSAPPLLSGFLRRRHLARRLVSLAEEVTMSRIRLALGGALMGAVLVGSGAAALAAWPLTPMPQAHQMAFSPAPDDVAQIGRRVDVPFPEAVIASGLAEAIVDVAVEVDGGGAVTSARAATVTVHGGENGLGAVAATPAIDGMVSAAVDAIGDWRFKAPDVAPGKLIVTVRFAAETRQAVVTRISARAGYPSPPVLKVGGVIKAPKKLVNVQPVYPQEAMDAKVQGVVVMETVIDEAGAVKEAWVLQSVPMLDQAALDAVRQWRYEPTLMNGVPRPVQVTVTVNFTLAP